MPDPRFELTAQELTYAASALRAEARRAERQAADPTFHASRQIFEDAARVYDQLGAKFDWIARSGRALHWGQRGPLPERAMNWVYARAEKHANEAMLDFAGMEMTNALRELVRSKIALAYTTASREAWQEAAIAMRLVGERRG